MAELPHPGPLPGAILPPMRRGDIIDDRFEIEELVGGGAMGSIHRARDRMTGATVALKTVRGGEFSARFVREARVLAGLSHPAVVRYVAHGALPSAELFLAMEWLEGEDLARRLRRTELSPHEALVLASRVAGALGAAHALGIVHRDVKPGNIFLPQGDVALATLIDFGIARLSFGTQVATQTGMMLGTPGYMAPEQAKGLPGTDARADVFALGCVLYRCLSGRAAFAGEDLLAVLAKLVLEEPPSLSALGIEIPAALSDLVARMMAKEPEDRPRDGAVVARALAEIPLSPGGMERAPNPPPRSITRAERRLVSVVVVAPEVPHQRAAANEVTTRVSAEGARLERIESFEAQLVSLADGSLVATLQMHGEPTDQAAQAARYALALKAALASRAMVLATGHRVLGDRVPFGEVIDRAAALLGRTLPAEGAALRRDLPVRVDEVTAGLLSHRFEIGGDEISLFLEREREPFGATARTLLGAPTDIVGREREIAAIESVFEECVAESEACAVVVIAPAGVGKSRLGGEVLRRIAARTGTSGIWIARGDPVGAGSPLQMLGQAIRRCTGIQSGEPLGVRQQKLRARVGRNVSAHELSRIAEFLGELTGVPYSDEGRVELQAARRDPLQMGDAMRYAFEDFLAAECKVGPVVIVLEDLHWGDLPSVQWLDAALRNLHDRPLLVLALARPEVAELFPGLWAGRRKHEIRLLELSRRTSERLVQQALGASAEPAIVARIVERARGNAFYLEELIRAVAEGRGEELPETVLAMVEARLAALPEGARRVLRAASAFGQFFWRGGVAELLGVGLGPGEIAGWLEELSRREVITRRREGRFAGDEEYMFRHALVREAAYAMLTEEDRRLGHLLAAAWLTRAGETDAAVLAEHFERGGEPERAVSLYLRAAEQALEGNDYVAAVARAERGVTCGAEGEVRGALRLVQAEASRHAGQNLAVGPYAVEATRLLPRGTPGWFSAFGELVYASSTLGDHDRLLPLAEELLSVEACGTPSPRVIAASRVAVHLTITGRREAAKRLLAMAEEALQGSVLDDAALGFVAGARSALCIFDGDVVGLLDFATAAAEHFERVGAIRPALSQWANVAYAYVQLGAQAEGEQAFRDTLTTADRMGLPYISTQARYSLALILARNGAIDDGISMVDVAIAATVAYRISRDEGFARINRAKILLLAGDAAGAEQEARTAADIPRIARSHRAYTLAVVGQALLAQERIAEARDTTEQAMELLRSAGGIEEGEALIHLTHIEALLASGLSRQAQDVLAGAYARLLERAAKISDPMWRESFLSRVPEHARLLDLARAWLDTAHA